MAEPISTRPAPEKHHLTFFRQSGWMMIATTGGGVFMMLVHKFACQMPKDEYGVFTALLQVVTLMSIPAVGLNGVFAQQAAGVMTPAHERELGGTFRSVLRALFFLWLAAAATALIFQATILEQMQITNPAAIWATVGISLMVLWRPVLGGVLQGRQNFLWLGNVAILDGLGRLLAVMLIVGALHHHAAGAMTAVLLGIVLATAATGWFVRDCWRGETAPMQWGAWLSRVVPLTLGLGVAQFMLAADMIFVQKFFSKEQTGYYAAAGTVGRALVYFTLPVAAVMFPKLARSKATGEKSHALALALGVTLLAGLGAALMCTLFPALPVRILLNKSFQEISAPLVPWFAWGMLPLTLATVLINSLMAQARFAAVPWLLTVAGGYALTLYLRLSALANPTEKQFLIVIQTLGIFSLLLLGVCAWFTWGAKPKSETKI